MVSTGPTHDVYSHEDTSIQDARAQSTDFNMRLIRAVSSWPRLLRKLSVGTEAELPGHKRCRAMHIYGTVLDTGACGVRR